MSNPMIRLCTILLSAVTALWLGGLGALFAFATALFAHDRAVASLAVPVLFQTFAVYHLVAAGLALILVVSWRVAARPRMATALLVLICVATACALASTLALGKMEQLRRDDPRPNMMDQPTFRRMHIASNVIYAAEAVAVLAAVIVLAARAEAAPPAGRDARDVARAPAA
jgi:hypothetical protein